MSDDTTGMPSGEELKQLAAKLHELLKIRTLPIGMKQYESLEEMQAVPGIRFPKDGRHHTSCQLITQSRIAGFTLGITAANVRPGSNCGGVMGIDAPSEEYLSGKNFVGVWFENLEAEPIQQLRTIYDRLGLEGFQDALPAFHAYLASVRSYRRNRYEYGPDVIEAVEREWMRWVEQWGYSRPGGEFAEVDAVDTLTT